MSGTLTEFERKTLELLSDGRRWQTSIVGYELFKDRPKTRANPSPQGMALAAGRFLGPLMRRGFVHSYNGWHITKEGKEALRRANGG